ncbi:MAG: response regulator [Lachnospiraceae bacterium]|nr:response regulator [Lachnospiraceae bacterium]
MNGAVEWIVVVDDDLMNLKLAGRILSEDGMRVTALGSGEALLEHINENGEPDLVLLDLLMPGMDGFETYRRLRELEKEKSLAEVPVVFLTADDNKDTEAAGLSMGALDFIRKPLVPGVLQKRIRNILNNPLRARQEKPADEQRKHICKESTIEDLRRISDMLDERNIGSHALWLEREEFTGVYRYMMRYIQRYHEKAYKLLFTVSPAEERGEGLNLEEASDRLGGVLMRSLRNSDIMMQCAANQFFLLLPMVAERDIHKVIERIMDSWRRTEYFEKTDVSCVEELIYSNGTAGWRHGEEYEPWIVVVDDDLKNMKLAGSILSENGMRVTALNGGQALLDLVADGKRPDLILLDILMPGMDGFETLRQMRGLEHAGDSLPVIFLTANDDEETEKTGLALGALDFIHKPFRPELLLLRVRHTLELVILQQHMTAEVIRKTNESEDLFLQVMRSVAGAVDAKDSFSKGHSQRVAGYAREIAARYGYSEKRQNDIYMAGLLHDVGNIGIPERLINKPSKLTEEEFAVIRKHPAKGAAILENIRNMPVLAQAARWHHERFSGGGYPDGLAGAEIPEEARILAVADAYDAMSSPRSYRKAMQQEQVRAEIEGGRGSQFDPVFADIMLKMIDEDIDYEMRES